jgi:hypothetical protein
MDINTIVKKLSPYHSLIIMLIFFGGVFLSLYKIIISPSDLRINIRNEAVVYPKSVADNFIEVNKYLSENDTLLGKGYSAYNFLSKTTDIKTITIKNTSDRTLRDVNFKHLNTRNLNAYSITSTFLTSKEQDDLYANLVEDDKREIVYLNRSIDLPPKKELIISLWGSFNDDTINQNVIVGYEGGDAYFENQYMVSGFQGYIYENTFPFIVLIIIIFCLVYYMGIEDVKKNIVE